ncbi:hypothetical protein EJB05_02907, partial [Eragrostis curvula]
MISYSSLRFQPSSSCEFDTSKQEAAFNSRFPCGYTDPLPRSVRLLMKSGGDGSTKTPLMRFLRLGLGRHPSSIVQEVRVPVANEIGMVKMLFPMLPPGASL